MSGYSNTEKPFDGYILPAAGAGTVGPERPPCIEPPHEFASSKHKHHPEFHRGCQFILSLLHMHLDHEATEALRASIGG